MHSPSMLISDINTILYEIVWAVVQGHLKKELASTLLLESLVSVFRAFDAIQCTSFLMRLLSFLTRLN